MWRGTPGASEKAVNRNRRLWTTHVGLLYSRGPRRISRLHDNGLMVTAQLVPVVNPVAVVGYKHELTHIMRCPRDPVVPYRVTCES